MAGKGGDAKNLWQYWAYGPGAAKIRWGTPGDWTRCRRHLAKYIADPEGYCQKMHHAVTGVYTGDKRNPG